MPKKTPKNSKISIGIPHPYTLPGPFVFPCLPRGPTLFILENRELKFLFCQA